MTQIEQIRAEIDRLQEAQLDECRNFNSEYKEGIFDGLSMLDRFIDSLPKETPQSWISVKDRLPDNNEYVLTCSNTKGATPFIELLYYKDGKWLLNEFAYPVPIEYWMPIPEFKEK